MGETKTQVFFKLCMSQQTEVQNKMFNSNECMGGHWETSNLYVWNRGERPTGRSSCDLSVHLRKWQENSVLQV